MGKRNKVGKDERNHRKIIDLSGCSAELLSQLPPILGVGRPLVGAEVAVRAPLLRTETSSRSCHEHWQRTALSRLPFRIVLLGAAHAQGPETKHLLAGIWNSPEEPFQLQGSR